MEKLNEELIAELREGGIIDNLREKITSFIRAIDYLNAELLGTDSRNYLEIEKEIDTIKRLLADIRITQKIADEILENMSAEQRKELRRAVPEVLTIFGWYDLLTENGEIKNSH